VVEGEMATSLERGIEIERGLGKNDSYRELLRGGEVATKILLLSPPYQVRGRLFFKGRRQYPRVLKKGVSPSFFIRPLPLAGEGGRWIG
jgi:hypothetical protein